MFQFAGDFPNAPEAGKNTHLIIKTRIVPLLLHQSVMSATQTNERANSTRDVHVNSPRRLLG
jgi:hypothetical protein